MIKKGWRIKGIVQGVGYRYFVFKKARSISLKGYVKNLSDGSVEVAAYGKKEMIEELEKELIKGPPAAAIFSITSFEPSLPLEEMGDFEIQY